MCLARSRKMTTNFARLRRANLIELNRKIAFECEPSKKNHIPRSYQGTDGCYDNKIQNQMRRKAQVRRVFFIVVFSLKTEIISRTLKI